MTLAQIQALELEGDKDGEPRILLRGETPYFFTGVVLNVDCQTIAGSRQIEVYMQVTRSSSAPPLFSPPFEKTSDEIRYSVDGEDGSVQRWSYRRYEDDTEARFAPALVEEALIEALLENPRKLVVTLHPGKDYATDYVFQPVGFEEAVKPVLQFCGA